jgi:hypothetical protein
MRLTILHALTSTCDGRFISHMTRVAALETGLPLPDALEEAFRLTQHADDPWDIAYPATLRPEMDEPRSTSVGDVILVDDREAFQWARGGWKSVNVAVVKALTT